MKTLSQVREATLPDVKRIIRRMQPAKVAVDRYTGVKGSLFHPSDKKPAQKVPFNRADIAHRQLGR